MNLFAGFTAFFLGALHALEPGHGKSAIAAYAVGYRSNLWHVLVLGLTAALAHTFTILVLALLLGGAVSTVASETTHIYIELLSCFLILGTGIWLWIKTSTLPKNQDCPSNTNCRCHNTLDNQEKPVSFGAITLLGISIGLLPCPTALAVLLSSMTAGHFVGGMLTVCLFSIGIAITMCIVALTSMILVNSAWAKKLRGFFGESSRFRMFPLISAGIIIICGVFSLFRVFLRF